MRSGTETQPTKKAQLNIADGFMLIILAYLVYFVYKKTRRISYTEDLPENYEGMRLPGVVTGISDGDGFRFFHCPWLQSRTYTSEDARLYVRLAGIDAPEMEHGSVPEQPFALESKEYLRRLIQGKEIEIKVVGKDQYDRVLAFAYLPAWFSLGFCRWFQMDFLYTNVNLKMVEQGYACVYTGRDAKYDKYEETLKSLEIKAKREKRGMWILPNLENPMRHKRIHRM